MAEYQQFHTAQPNHFVTGLVQCLDKIGEPLKGWRRERLGITLLRPESAYLENKEAIAFVETWGPHDRVTGLIGSFVGT